MPGLKVKASLLIKLLQNEIQSWIHFKNSKGVDTNLIKNLRRDGYVVIEDFYPAEKCDLIRRAIDEIIVEYPEILWVDEAKSDFRIFGAERASSIISEFFSNKKLLSFGEQFLRQALVNHMTLAARLEFKTNNAGSGGGWHRDSPFENQFKSILYLSDVTEANGPYQFVTGSHTIENQFKTLGFGKNLMRFSNDEVNAIVRTNNKVIKTFVAKKGTLILTNTRGLHRGKPIDEGSRYALTNYYTPEFRASTFASFFTDVIKEPNKPFKVE